MTKPQKGFHMDGATKTVRKGIRVISNIVNLAVLAVILLFVAYACYGIWDSSRVYQAADAAHYTVYKPDVQSESVSFEELQAINPEVFSWLTVYGTNIDYPVTQGTNNIKYVNTNPQGEYSLSGAIFLDWLNSRDFGDFNSILYGHHMEKSAMFGELEKFSDGSFFYGHAFGNLYYDGANHGLEFFAFLKVDAYDRSIFKARVQGMDQKQSYLDNLLQKALHIRDVGVTANDHLVLLSTCSAESTNGRDILVAKVVETYYRDPFETEQDEDSLQRETVDRQTSWWRKRPGRLWGVLVVVLLMILLAVVYHKFKKNRTREQERNEKNS